MINRNDYDKRRVYESPSDFGFELNPLDVNIAKMQHNLLETIKERESNDLLPFEPIVENYVSQNPLREYGEITIELFKDEHSLTGLMYIAKITVKSKNGDFFIETQLFRGYWEDMKRYIEGETHVQGRKWAFFPLCKATALWLDYQVKADREQKRLESLEDELARGWERP